MSDPFRSLAISLDKRLKQVTDMAVNINLDKIRIENYINGKNQLITQGDSEADLYQIMEGEAHILRHTENGYVPLANLHSGDFFGNVSFLDLGHEPYQASVFASEDLKVKKMDLDVLQKEHSRLSPTFKNFLEHLATSVSVTSMLACEFHKKTGQKEP